MIQPGFDIIQSNRLEILADRLCEDLASDPLSSPLAREIILVQDPSVGRWFEMFLARKAGVAANLRFLNPAQLFADLYRSLDPSLRGGSPYDPELLQWRLFAVLNDRKFTARHPELEHYLRRGDQARTFDLASRVAQTFNRYLVYRMDWIAEWESRKEGKRGKDELWQAALWRTVTSAIGAPHHGQLFARLRTALREGALRLPERIVVFGINALSPAYAELLTSAGARIAVRLYVLNPCREEWSGIADERALADTEYSPDLLHVDVPHALLGSFGKQGRDFMGTVAERAGEGSGTIDLFASPGDESLLRFLQSGILTLTEGSFTVPPGDRSVQIHSCHTPMREVQVLRDRLLDLFASDPTLKPSEVMVLAPDINEFAPYVEAVFASSHDPTIPFEIADRSPAQMDPAVEAWLALLELPRSRFEADTVVDLLRLAPVGAAFRIAPEEIERVSEWVERSGIRWGIDGAQRKALDLPEDDGLFTWAWGLERLVLGVALPSPPEGPELFHGRLPSGAIEGEEIDLLDRFLRYVDALKEWTESLKQPRPAEQWGELFGHWLDRLFPGGKEISEQREEIRAAVDQAVAAAGAAGYAEPVDHAVIRRIMRDALGENLSGLRFHSGGVVFCSMRPMRALPFRVIYLLGLSDGAYPRERRAPGFDLMRRYVRTGDRSGRLDDRYLFLELLLAARDRFILSYVGEDVNTGKPLPPSPVVGEFLDFVGRVAFGGPGSRARAERALLVRHPLQSFSTKYFDGGDRELFSYSAADLRTCNAVLAGRAEIHDIFPAPLPRPTPFPRKVTLDELCAFVAHPARYLLRNRLNVRYRVEEDPLEGAEPLVVGKAEAAAIRRGLMEVAGGPPETEPQLYDRLRADGKLPAGVAGRSGFDAERRNMLPVLGALRELLETPARAPIDTILKLGSWEVVIEEQSGLTADGIYSVKPGKLTGKDILPFWIRFLAVSLALGNETFAGKLLGVKEAAAAAKKRGGPSLAVDLLVFRRDPDARGVLERLLEWYETGLCRPVRLFPKSGWAYAESFGKNGDRDLALKAAERIWTPPEDGQHFAEGDDAYNRRLFPPDESALDEEFLQLTGLFAQRAFNALQHPDVIEKPKPAAKKAPRTGRKR